MADPVDITFHYPPDLFNLLVDALPRLCRSKKDLVLFFRGAGVGDDVLGDLWQVVLSEPDTTNKYEITRTLLKRLNERGESSLRERRELLRRVVQFDDFSTCWPGDQPAAKGYVSDIRRIVDVKDAFTRMRQERDRERRQNIQAREAQTSELRRRKEAKARARKKLYGLFKEGMDAHKRGREFEAVLNELFQLDGILIRESFRREGKGGQTLEQIDGAVEISGHLYLVEAKWHKDPIDVQDIHVLLSRLFIRPEAEARGIFISANGYTSPAIQLGKQATSKRVLLLCTLHEIVQILECEENFAAFFKKKADQAITLL